MSRVVLAAALTGALVAGCAASGSSAPGRTGSASVAGPSASASAPTPSAPTPSTTAACTAESEALPLKERVGQLVMVGVEVGLPAGERAAIKKHHLGSAIVMGPTAGVEQVGRLSAQLAKLGGTSGMLVAADQEGGQVQRLRGRGFGTVPSAERQARLSESRLTKAAAGWGRAMAKAGVRLNLAPVADVVPAARRSTNQPVARLGRGYGSDPEKVSSKVAAFSEGMDSAGVSVAVKHFPGLGAVRENTDHAKKVVDRTTTSESPLLQPFRDAVEAGTPAVMVSSAYYTKIDADHPAMYSADVIGILRYWGFDGVVVSDDLGTASAASSVPARERALRFVKAGGDLAITVDVSVAGPMASGLLKEAKANEKFAAKVTASAARVLALKESLGLTRCG